MKWLIRIICFVITTLIYIPINIALNDACFDSILISLLTLIIYFFIFYIPSNAIIAMKENGENEDEGFWAGVLSFLILFLLSILSNLPTLLMCLLPFTVIELPVVLLIIFSVLCLFLPVSSVIFWIWGVISVLINGWDTWPIIYCILFVAFFIPSYLGGIAREFSRSRRLY